MKILNISFLIQLCSHLSDSSLKDTTKSPWVMILLIYSLKQLKADNKKPTFSTQAIYFGKFTQQLI